MSKITIPKEAMKYATQPYISLEQFRSNNDKFAKIMYKHYPHLSRHEIDEINLNITKRGIKINWMNEYQEEKRQEMLDIHRRYLDYKMRGDYESLAVLEDHYFNVNKKCYDNRVDELREMGYDTKYAPTNIADLKKFNSTQTSQKQLGYLVPFIIAVLGMVGFVYLCLPK